eukprot:TRINITY_DN604_c1_g1_i1.p1 TRINITY_DN604_c1_g1~~TRINITY_DN604_c1_g1_i1.p1  ORF type:complete len:286 (-),score=7.05 TRINITY_DN604_c1_g1_i1:12-869(-)
MDSATLATGNSSYLTRLLPNPNPNPNSPSLLRIYRRKRCFSKILKCSSQNSNPNPNPNSNPNLSSTFPLKSDGRNPNSSFSCSATTETPLSVSDSPCCKLQLLVTEFESLSEPIERVKRLLHYANLLPGFAESDRIPGNRVMGCTAQVWLSAAMDGQGRMRFAADSDSEITKGFCSCLIWILDGAYPEEVLKLRTEDLGSLHVGLPGRAHSRVNTWHNVLISMQKRTKAMVTQRDGKAPVDPFPSLVVDAENIVAMGSYAEAQVSKNQIVYSIFFSLIVYLFLLR